MSNNVLLIYLFDSGVYSAVDTIDKAIKAAKPLALNAKKFAASLNIGYRDDHWGVIDDSFSFRLSFYIEGSQDVVLPKVSALFAFAASYKLVLINQYFFTK